MSLRHPPFNQLTFFSLLLCFFRYAGQSSKSTTLEAGKYYYIIGLQKGTESTDSLSAGVRLPSGRFMRPITKEILQWRMPGKKELEYTFIINFTNGFANCKVIMTKEGVE